MNISSKTVDLTLFHSIQVYYFTRDILTNWKNPENALKPLNTST